jgi:hypothetical protein
MFTMPPRSVEARALSESSQYAAAKPRRTPPADSPNRPILTTLYRYALWVRDIRPHAKLFRYEGVRYAIVWEGHRLCVMHMPTHRILVGAPGPRHE